MKTQPKKYWLMLLTTFGEIVRHFLPKKATFSKKTSFFKEIYEMKQDFDDFFIEKLKEAYEIAVSDQETDEMPKEAVKKGTIVKSLRHDRTGVVVDSFYGDYDKDNQKIIIYPILFSLLSPNPSKIFAENLLMYSQYSNTISLNYPTPYPALLWLVLMYCKNILNYPR